MIKIRYAHLPEGLHAWVASKGRHTIIYLRPTLGPSERRDALLRVLRNGRRGYGPRLPAAGLLRAVSADKATRTVRNAAAAAHCHPVGTLGMAGLLVAVLACYLALTGPGSLAGLPQARTGPPLSSARIHGGATGPGARVPVIQQPLGSRLTRYRGPVPEPPSQASHLPPQHQPPGGHSRPPRRSPRNPSHWHARPWPWHPRHHAARYRPGQHRIASRRAGHPRPEAGRPPSHGQAPGHRHHFAPHPRPGLSAPRPHAPGRAHREQGPGRAHREQGPGRSHREHGQDRGHQDDPGWRNHEPGQGWPRHR